MGRMVLIQGRNLRKAFMEYLVASQMIPEKLHQKEWLLFNKYLALNYAAFRPNKKNKQNNMEVSK